MLTMKDTRTGKKNGRDYLNRSQMYVDEYGNFVLKVDGNQVLLMPECILWNIKDQYTENDEFTEVKCEVIIS